MLWYGRMRFDGWTTVRAMFAATAGIGSKLGGAAKVGGAGGAATKAIALSGAAGSTAAAAVAATSQNLGSSPSISPSER